MIRKQTVTRGGSYRPYDSDNLTNAYLSVMQSEMSIRKASRFFGVPYTTLNDRVAGRVDVDVIKSGTSPLFSQEQEALLSGHLKTMSEIGYGYSRQETMNLATDYAIHLGLRGKEQKPLTDKWLFKFLGRWPELKLKKPRALEIARAKSATRNAIDNYFKNLKQILVKYNLLENPHRMFNIDEKGLCTEHKPPKVVAGKHRKTQAVTSSKSKIVTLIGCINGVGQQVPPFFVFPGARMVDGLMAGASPGAAGTVTETGWSNTDIFCQFMQDHLVKYLPARDKDNPVLVLYDGHKSHCSLGLIEWAKSQHIILFVLPPHCSHILQPLDVSCFGPFEVAWNAACHKYMRESGGCTVTRYDVCHIACKVFTSTLTVNNITSAFRKCGLYPFNDDVVPDHQIAPATSFSQEARPILSKPTAATKSADSFLVEKGGQLLKNVETAKKSRNTLSKVIAGKPITEDDVVKKHKENQTSKQKPSKSKSSKIVLQKQKTKSPTPGTS
ncbi:uncharacterized protein LOC132729962, partial [Ruditapes philippinarum]|uniref:uncharacterized protein LOC132729962 n=1 Tax=Ruditapes philippinarum TaxID=129788 RepID=UPI00295B547E